MALIQCAECGGKVSDKASSCPHCGAPVTPQQPDAPQVPNYGAVPVQQQHPSYAQPHPQAPQQPYSQPYPQPYSQPQPQRYSQPQPQPAYSQPQPAPYVQQQNPPAAARPPMPAAEPKPPTRAHGFVALLIFLPVLLLTLHLIAFGWPGSGILALLFVAGFISGLVVLTHPKLRLLTPSEIFRRLLKRKVLTGVLLGVVLLAEMIALGGAIPTKMWRSNFDRMLASQDPCVVESVKDVDRASDEQLAALEKKTKQCAEQKRQEAHKRRTTQCREVAARAGVGKLTSEDLTFLEGGASLAKRISSGSLTAADFKSVDAEAMPCRDTPAGADWWIVFTKAAAKSSSTWAKIEPNGVSAKLSAAFGKTPLSADSTKSLTEHVEKTSNDALKGATGTSDLETGKGLCELCPKVGVKQPDICSYLLSKYQTFHDREEAAANAKRKVEEAKEAAEAKRAAAKAAQCDYINQRCDQVCGRYYGDMRDRCDMKCIQRLEAMGCN